MLEALLHLHSRPLSLSIIELDEQGEFLNLLKDDVEIDYVTLLYKRVSYLLVEPPSDHSVGGNDLTSASASRGLANDV